MNFEDLSAVKKLLAECQSAEADMRAEAKDDILFLHKTDGQWEPDIVQRMGARPRYTFDKTNPVVDSIAGELEQANFGIRVKPASSDASEDTAELYAGLIRSIQNISRATDVFNRAGRAMIECGFSALRVVQDYVDSDSFDQDLIIKKIENALDRVWFYGGESPDMSDAICCFVLHAITKEEYKKKYSDGACQSVSDNSNSQIYYYKHDYVVIGEFIYKKRISKEIALMNNGKVYEVNDEYQSIIDELAQQGVTEKRRRKIKATKVYTRLFDNADWLNSAQETVFDELPVIPTFGNFTVVENKPIYRGVVRKLKDPQRVFNYSESRQIEEGALSPREKLMMTPEQARDHASSLRTMNVNSDPVQFYNHVDGQPAPFKIGGAQINPGLSNTSASMRENIIEASGVFAANQGNSPNQSGVAIDLQQQKGDISTIKYFSAQERAIAQTCRVIINAIPKVYDTQRTVRILGEDGAAKMQQLNKTVIDNQTGKPVTPNDLRSGKYDVTCSAGAAFQSRQQETVKTFIEMAAIDPSILQDGKDIMLSNLNQPGMDALSERVRKQMLEAGMIPDAQMTDEEKQAMQQKIEAMQSQQQEPSVMDQAIIEQTQANTADIQSKAMERMAKIEQGNAKVEIDQQKLLMQAQAQQNQAVLNEIKTLSDVIKSQAEAWDKMRSAQGIDAVVTPEGVEVYKEQAEVIGSAQDAAS